MKVKITHFNKDGDFMIEEIWTLKTPLTGNFKADKARMIEMVPKEAYSNEFFIAKTFAISWDMNGLRQIFLLENK